MPRNQWLVRLLSILLCITTASLSMAQTVAPALRISILEGEGALNNIRQRTAREPIVQVNDQNNRPVAGAAVLFLLPDSGPGGEFANGARSLTVLTDQNGQARASGFRPNAETGAFVIQVVATVAGLRAEAVIRQRNIAGVEEHTGKSEQGTHEAGAGSAGAHGAATHGILASKWVYIGAALAAGAAAGIAAGVKSGGGGRSITITPGAATVGPPK